MILKSKILVVLIILISFQLPAQKKYTSEQEAALKKSLMGEVDSKKVFTQQMVDMLFSFGELGFQEFESSKYVTKILRENGFVVEEGTAGIPTAWTAKWGSGKPVI